MMKAEVEYVTSETCGDFTHVIDFRVSVAIEERVFIEMPPAAFMNELRYLLIRTGHDLLDAAEGRPYKLERLWENRIRIRLSDRKMPVMKPLIAKEAMDDSSHSD